jgi:hypothetical protein
LIAEALQEGHSIVALGDLNDFDSTIVDASGNVPISEVLSILRDPVTSTPGDGKKKGGSGEREEVRGRRGRKLIFMYLFF